MSITKKKCKTCETEFYATSRGVFCSPNCRKRNFRLKKKMENESNS